MVNKKKVPLELAGYKNELVWVHDHINETQGFCLVSVVNEDHHDDDFLEWHGDSVVDDCPF